MPEIHYATALKPAISKFEFLERFTLAELTAFEAAAETDPALRAWARLVDAVQVVDLQHDKVRAGLDLLVSKGVINQSRKEEIRQSA